MALFAFLPRKSDTGLESVALFMPRPIIPLLHSFGYAITDCAEVLCFLLVLILSLNGDALPRGEKRENTKTAFPASYLLTSCSLRHFD